MRRKTATHFSSSGSGVVPSTNRCYRDFGARGQPPRVTRQDLSIMTVTTAIPASNANLEARYASRTAVASWIMFDWAAQPYFTLITTFVFAPYFATFVA